MGPEKTTRFVTGWLLLFLYWNYGRFARDPTIIAEVTWRTKSAYTNYTCRAAPSFNDCASSLSNLSHETNKFVAI